MARTFNRAASDKIVSAATAALNPANITIAGWININSTAGFDGGFGTRASVGTSSPGWATIQQTGPPRISFQGSGNFGGWNSGTTNITFGVWMHLAVYSNGPGNTGAFYVNGSLNSTAGSMSAAVSGNCMLSAGLATSFNTYLDGTLADIAIWNTVLTPTEIGSLARGGRPGGIRPANLLVWWPMDGQQSLEPDLSGKGNNGTLTGTAPGFNPPISQFTPRWPRTVESGIRRALQPQIVT